VLSEAADQIPLVQLLKVNGKREYIKALQEPEEVAAEMLWLGSYSASFINGQVIIMDSG
jgi:NAD(P)-dependent dehydrogenase (short-subunit alcohol dehydrogenase family)